MKEYLPLLLRCPLFECIHPDALLRMLSCLQAQRQQMSKGSIILHQGDAAGTFGVLLSGSAHIIHDDSSGSHSVIAHIAATEMFAEAIVCAGNAAMPFHVVAAEDCTVILLNHSRVMQGCRRGCMAHSQLVTALLRIISQKNLLLSQKLQIVMQRTTREKLMAYLMAQSQRAGSPRFTIPFDRQALADYLGVERSAMSTELNRLKKEGWVDFHRNDFDLTANETSS